MYVFIYVCVCMCERVCDLAYITRRTEKEILSWQYHDRTLLVIEKK